MILDRAKGFVRGSGPHECNVGALDGARGRGKHGSGSGKGDKKEREEQLTALGAADNCAICISPSTKIFISS